MMTSEVEALKTNEFLRRRKLRIQQVREQSKDIAKKIRQRASAEKFKHIVDLNSTKGKEYLEQQDKLIRKLELLHAKSSANIGTSHRNAAVEVAQENPEKVDLSKQRAREAVAELRRRKQEQLDKRKKLLDRKLRARETANEISREKSTSVLNKLSKTSQKSGEELEKLIDIPNPETAPEQTSKSDVIKEKETIDVVRSDMATQSDFDVPHNDDNPKEWEPHVPTLILSKNNDPKDSTPKNPQIEGDTTQRPNLFALSDEMPSSLRGTMSTAKPMEKISRESLNLVSEFIKNRDLRLRDYDTGVIKKPNDELQSIKQTIQRTRASRVPVSGKPVQVTPGNSKDDSTEISLAKKNSVTMYNHSTRDVKDVPYGDKKLVMRDQNSAEDAYTQAMKETTSEKVSKERDHQKKLQDMRYKIAMSKQNIEKEFRDTMSFLNSLPKDNSKPIRNAFKDDFQQELQKELRQKKLQYEFKKVQKDCSKHPQAKKVPIRPKLKVRTASDEDFEAQDSLYSWMPVPESDGGLAIHIIPTKVKENKCGNNVRFSKIDSYHEYRSRHKHTPPTKDTEPEKKTVVEADSTDDSVADKSASSDNETSSVEDLQLEKEPKSVDHDRLSDAEKIIVYKILKSKADKQKLKKKGSKIDIAKSLSFVVKECQVGPNRGEVGDHSSISERRVDATEVEKSHKDENTVPKQGGNRGHGEMPDQVLAFEQEGVYRTISKKGRQQNSVDRVIDNSDGDTNVNTNRNRVVDRVIDKSNGDTNVNNKKLATASSASFDTANGDNRVQVSTKKSNINSNLKDQAEPNGGFVQLVDEKGQESGKFYIGASGFLKDDNYEVVIQVRKTDKKETEPEISQAVIKENMQPPGVACSLAKDNTEISTAENPACQLLSSGTEPGPFKDSKIPTQENVNPTLEENVNSGTEDVVVQSVDYQAPRYVDRSVDVPFQDSFESTSVPRPEMKATSVSVQTLIDSSETRPALLRLSSSASTTYLSPPELVLPQFLKRGRHRIRNNSDFYFPFTRSHRGNKKEENIGKHSSPNRTRKTKSPRRSMSPTSPSQRTNITKTPPNTARSNRINNYNNRINNNNNINNNYNNRINNYNDNGCKKKKSKKIRKCPKHDPIAYLKTYTQKVKKAPPLAPPPSRCSTKNHNRCVKGNLSPIMKWYVDKLLALNKEGLRTIEVLNQSCSEVTTPGSSIVEDPCNIKNDKRGVSARISLEQLKFAIVEEVLKQYELLNHQTSSYPRDLSSSSEVKKKNITKFSLRFPRSKSVHKVKSLNVSRSLLPKNKYSSVQINSETPLPAASSKESDVNTIFSNRSKSTLTSRSISSKIPKTPWSSDKVIEINATKSCVLKNNDKMERKNSTPKEPEIKPSKNELTSQKRKTDNQSVKHESVGTSQSQTRPAPLHTATQTIVLIDDEIKSIKEAENKIQNMEKIANLTDKCTKRLSNLVKVLEEVRKNKLPCNQVSGSPSDTDYTDQTSGKNSDTHLLATSYEPIIEIKEKSPRTQGESCPPEPLSTQAAKTQSPDISGPQSFLHLLKDIAKPTSPNPLSSPAKESEKHIPTNQPINNSRIQGKSKPPPALPRCLRRTSEFAVPHELSTVLEVDSPLSKHKSQTHSVFNKEEASKPVDNEKPAVVSNDKFISKIEPNPTNPDVLPSRQFEEANISTDSSDDTKMRMMDLQQFNEIMLKPFISIQEFAKQCNIANIDEGSNLESISKDNPINEDLSSLHSDGSLPDVIAELLKRNIISEPFKFETVSNINSTTVSSDSTLSILALSKRKNDKKSIELSLNKDVEESSDSMSISSNPDLENAFKKLGMGWASSTLKKTKERLALSSSSNTSSSSLSQYKFKSTKSGEFPVLVTDSMSCIKNVSKSAGKQHSSNGNKKSFQTSIATSMTVKQFLTEELAKRITFSEKPNETEEEFVSLYETKMPEDMKKSHRRVICEERSIDSNSRARTSTPVQIYKSINYQSSSGSNVSNGLFSNVEDLSSVKGSSSFRNHSTSEKDDLTVPNLSLRTRKGTSEGSKSDD